MGYNEPEGNNHYLDDCDMVCERCDHKIDVDDGEYVGDIFYCKDCYNELYKQCPKCNNAVISVDEDCCEDCAEEAVSC